MRLSLFASLFAAWMLASPAHAQGTAAVVSHIHVLSDKVEDASSIEALARAVIKDGMTGEQKALALWETVVKLRHHDRDAREYLGLNDDICHDAIRIFNSYGYCTGRGAHIALRQLARAAGMPVRAVSVNRWGTNELFYDGSWHCLDPGMIFYFRKPDGAIASVEELTAGVTAWYAAHPEIGGPDREKKVREFLKAEGWAKGPDILTRCPTMNQKGDFPLNFFAWYSAMLIFDGTAKAPFLFEEPSTSGHRVNLRLCHGERIVRRWSNDARFVDAADGAKLDCLGLQVGKGSLYYTPKFGDLGNGRVGAGRVEWNVPLAGAFTDPARPGALVLRRPSGYVYLCGEMRLTAKTAAGGAVRVELSDTNGRQWKEIARVDRPGEAKLDLTPYILRRYDYSLRLTLEGAGTSVESLSLAEDVQCSQRALPALDKGANAITFSAGPQESTVTVEAAGLKWKGKQPTYEDMGAQIERMDAAAIEKYGTFSPAAPDASIAFPIETPGDIARLRVHCNYRASNKDEAWIIEASFDDGGSWKSIGRAEGPTRNDARTFELSAVPAGTRKALVRLRGTQTGSLVLFSIRIDADYKEPGGFRPVKVTFAWSEAGVEKTHVHVARSPRETYTITCAEKPVMKSISLELAD